MALRNLAGIDRARGELQKAVTDNYLIVGSVVLARRGRGTPGGG